MPDPVHVRFAGFEIDEGNARLSNVGRPVDIPPKAFELLCTLARHPGKLVTKNDLLDAVWGHRHVSESVLKTTISHVRTALGDDAKAPRVIETVPRRGYRFIAAVEGGAPAAAGAPSARAAPLPLPELPATGLVGRGEPLGELRIALDGSQRGKAQVVFVAGEAGIGKTTLIDRFVSAVPDGVTVARGQCVEHYGVGEPYMPVLEALNLLCRGEAGTAMVQRLRRFAPTWLMQLPWFLDDEGRHLLRREVAGATPERWLREFGELMDHATAGQPLVLVLEDLHWSDHATVQLVGYLARRRSPAALMLIASFRPTEVIVEDHPLAGLRQELKLHKLVRELDLEAFSESEVGDLVADRLDGQAPPEEFVRSLHAHTEGLPLFVVNVLDELIAEGQLQKTGTTWTVPDAGALSVPHSMVGVVEKQVVRLSDELQRVLGAASVAGAEFMDLPLADVLQIAPTALERLLAAPDVRGHWIRSLGAAACPDGRIAERFAFRHVLYRHVFYQRVGAAQRLAWHRQVGAALLAAHGSAADEIAPELAMHFERGQDAPAAIQQLAKATLRALSRGAAHEALRTIRHALNLYESRAGGVVENPETELQLRVLEGLSLNRRHVITEPEVASVFERAHALCARVPPGPIKARALHGLWLVNFARGQLRTARQLARDNLALATLSGNLVLKATGSTALGMTLTMMGEFVAAKGHLETAMAAIEELGADLPVGIFPQDPAVEARSYLSMVLLFLGESEGAHALTREAVRLAFDIRHPMSQVFALHVAGVVNYFAGNVQEALASVDRIFEVIRANDLPAGPGAFAWVHGHALVDLGRVEEGLAEMRAAEANCRALGLNVAMSGFHLHFGEALRDTGRFDEAMATVDQGLARSESAQERMLLSPLHHLKSTLLARKGDRAGADEHRRLAIEVARAQGSKLFEARAQRAPLR